MGGLKLLLRVCWRAQKQGRAFSSEIPAERIRAAVKKVRESLSNRRGEVYQLCLHVLRSVQPLCTGGGGATSGGSGSDVTGNKSAKSPHRKAARRVEQKPTPSEVGKP